MFVRSDDPYISLCVSRHHVPEFLIPILNELQVEHPDSTRIEYAEVLP